MKVQTLPSRTILERDGALVTPEIAPTVPAQPRRWSRRHAYQCFQQGTAHVTDGRHVAISSSIPIDVPSRSEPLTRPTKLRPGRRRAKRNRYRIVIYGLHAGRPTDLDFGDPRSRRTLRSPRRHAPAPFSLGVSPTPLLRSHPGISTTLAPRTRTSSTIREGDGLGMPPDPPHGGHLFLNRVNMALNLGCRGTYHAWASSLKRHAKDTSGSPTV